MSKTYFRVTLRTVLLSLLLSILTIIPIQISFAPGAEAADCSATSANNLTATAAHGKVFYIDSGVSPKVDAAYVGYKINNTAGSGSQTGLWVSLETFSGGKVGLANPADSFQQLPSISAGSYKTAFFLLKASGPTTLGQAHTVKIYDKRPDLAGASALLTCTFTFTAVKETIKANANKVNSVSSSLSPGTPTLGGTLTISVTSANTGKVGQGSAPDNSLFWVSPAAVSTWPTRSLRLESTTIRLGCTGGSTAGNTTVTLTDTLSYANAQTACFSNASGTWTADYVFRIIGPGPSSLTPYPVAMIASGTQYKHSDISGLSFGSTVNLSGVASSAFTVTVTASSSVVSSTSSNAVVEYTVSMTTTSTTSVRVDEIIDKRALNTTFVAGSTKLNGVAISDPVTVTSEASLSPPPLHYIGPFSVVNTSTTTLVYRMNVPCAAGSASYTNVVYALVGDQILGASTTTLSAAVVTTITSGVNCDVTTTTTTETINPTGQTSPATNLASDSGTGISSATLNGYANAYGLANVTAAFRYSKDSNLTSSTTLTAQQSVTGSTPQLKSANISNLDPGTTYYFRIEVGSAQGVILNFTTPPILAQPVVTTGAVSNITGSGNNIDVTLNGQVNANLNTLSPITFEYCLFNASTCNASTMSANITTITVKTDDGSGAATNLSLSGSGDYPVDTNNIDGSKQITGLDSGNTYYYRTIATCTSTVTNYCPNNTTKFTGSIRQFTLGIIIVSTTEATAVASTTATLNGTANGNGANSQSWQFRYCAAAAGCTASSLSGTTNAPVSTTSIASNFNSSITTNLTGLTANTTYYFQAVGFDGGVAKSYGNILSFTTITITTSSLPGGTKDVSYNATVAGSGGSGSYSFAVTAGSLPTGLTLSTGGLISGTPTVSGTSNFTVTLTELYYNTTTTKDLSIAVIEVVTSAATNKSATGATLNGSASVNLGTPKFCYSNSNPNGNFDASSCTSVSAAEASSPYTAALSGLTASTTYWFQLTGTSGGNTYYGATLSFKTLPTLSTAAVTNLAATSATIRGTATEALTSPRLCFSATNPAGNFDWSASDCTSGTTNGTFDTFYTEALSGLTASTTYYYQLSGQVDGVTYYSSKANFTTAPTLTATAASSITATSATIGGTATESLTSPRLCFSSSNPAGDFDWSAASCSSGTTSGTNAGYTENLTGLSASTTYYFQLSGQVGDTTYYSDKLSFKTLPTVTTVAATSVGSTSATIRGTSTEAMTNGTLKLCFSSTNPAGNFDYASCDGGTVSGTFTGYTRSLTGLTASTTYYFQMIAQLGGATYYGSVLDFTTSAANAVYTVTFDGNSPTSGNPVAGSLTQASSGASVTLTGAGDLAKTGYTFGGWNESALGTGTNRDAGTAYTPTGDITLYAKWNPITYTITYKAGTNGSGADLTDSFVYGNTATLKDSSAALTRSGYSIGGWSTSDLGAQSYALSASYSAAANLILYPVWTAGTYTVTYNYDNATGGNGTASANYTSGNPPLTLPSPTKTGNTFAGWHSDSNKTVLVGGAAANYTPTQSLTLYAKWTINQYTITYDGNLSDGGSTPTAVTQNYNTTFTVASNTFTKTGHTFVNWNSDQSGNGTWYTEGASTYTIGAANASLYAIWSVNTYTVTYNGNGSDGGTAPVDASSPYNYGTVVTVLGNSGNLTKAGYTFGGWNTQNDGQGVARAASSTFTLGAANVILFAVWTQATQGGSGGSAPVIPGPTITNISKAQICSIGSEIVISGNYFDGAVVTLEGATTVVSSITTTTIRVQLPQAIAGKRSIRVTTPYGADLATIDYLTVPKPVFNMFTMPYLSEGAPALLPFTATNASTYSLIGALPSGLSLDTQTGLISGTPTTDGIFNFFIVASGLCGDTSQLVELDVDKETPNATSHRINLLTGTSCLNDSSKASLELFLEKVKALSPRNLVPDIFISGGGISNGSDLGDDRLDCVCDLLLEEEVYGNVISGEFTGSPNRIEIIVYWARP